MLVVYDQPEHFRDLLDARFPELPIRYVTRPAELEPALHAARPQVVFSIKHPGFPGDTHRPVIDFPSVRWVQVGGSGYEHFLPWDPNRLTLTNCAGVLSRFLAETVTGAMVMLNGGFLRYLDQQRERVWEPHDFRPLSEQSLLVVGVGAIGGLVAANARALGMRVLGVRRNAELHPSVDEMFSFSALPEAVAQADVVSLHVRLCAETTGLFDRDMLARMKPSSILINTARGPVVDEPALVEALQTGSLRAAYLDVFETEPLPVESPLWKMRNVFLTPHAADAVPDWPRRFGAFFADNLTRWLAGDELENVVIPTGLSGR